MDQFSHLAGAVEQGAPREAQRAKVIAYVALELNKTQQTVGNWESGIGEPNISELIKITNLFGISIRNIINSMTFVNYFLDFLTWFISYIVDLIKKIGK